ncbi:MAG: hypothetical protein K2W91_09150, partial [Novosphingobium sp.]|nr:hypothetical protein [Novosphingobium sp.]
MALHAALSLTEQGKQSVSMDQPAVAARNAPFRNLATCPRSIIAWKRQISAPFKNFEIKLQKPVDRIKGSP